MRYVSFHIKNFRGINDAIVELVPSGGGIFTLIGLNESGKTTVLEAISTFQIRGGDEKALYQAKPSQIEPASFVPKHEKATFTGESVVIATLEFEEGEREACIARTEQLTQSKIDPNSVPNSFTIKRGYRFENGDNKERISTWSVSLSAKTKGARKFKESIRSSEEPWKQFTLCVSDLLPEIVYFPTFLFEHPDRIVLNPIENERPADRLYRNIIENAGLSLEKPINIQTNIIDRVTKPETPGEVFAGYFFLSNNRQQQIESAVNQISHHISNTVLGTWSKIFGNSTTDREIRLKLGVDKHPNDQPRVYVQFTIRDGVQQYDISERSLGFRWFFAFLLFTLYRAAGSSGRKTFFLLDEPASNLHAGAQIQLLGSLPKIASDGNRIMYSTHSHYMISPEWLDQAFIISNSSMNYDDVSAKPIEGTRHTSVDIQKYRTFVGNNPDKTTYFQPVLDRLQVIPSKLDAFRPCILVEGKGDYLILSCSLASLGKRNLPYAILPTRGADHFGELVGMLLGWGINFAMCCDDDAPGRKAVAEFTQNWGIPTSRAFTITKIDQSLKGKSIEGFLESQDLKIIQKHYKIDKAPTKTQIQLFFSEKLAQGGALDLSAIFRKRIELFDQVTREALGVK